MLRQHSYFIIVFPFIPLKASFLDMRQWTRYVMYMSIIDIGCEVTLSCYDDNSDYVLRKTACTSKICFFQDTAKSLKSQRKWCLLVHGSNVWISRQFLSDLKSETRVFVLHWWMRVLPSQRITVLNPKFMKAGAILVTIQNEGWDISKLWELHQGEKQSQKRAQWAQEEFCSFMTEAASSFYPVRFSSSFYL